MSDYVPSKSAVSGSGARDVTAEHDYFDKWQAAEERATRAETGWEQVLNLCVVQKREVERLQGELAGLRSWQGMVVYSARVNHHCWHHNGVPARPFDNKTCSFCALMRAALAPQEGAEGKG